MEEVFEELNQPSVSVLKRVLRNRGIPFDEGKVDKFVRAQSTRQVQAANPIPRGYVTSEKLHDVWFADLIDLTAAPSTGGHRYILCAQDVFSRKIWSRALKTKKAQEVAPAFAAILSEAGVRPNEIVVDKGREFQAAFKELADREGIELKTKTSMRQIATIDSAIGKFKSALARDLRKAKTNDWASRLEKVTKGQNGIPKEYLDDKAPKDVEGDVELQEELEDKNAEFQAENRRLVLERKLALEAAGAFRVMLERPTNFARGFKPRWSDKVYEVKTVPFHEVEAESGEKFLTKFTLPVPLESEATRPSGIEAARPAQAQARRVRVLDTLADEVKARIGRRTVALREVTEFLKTRNFRTAALEARLNMARPTIAFLQTFPSLFEIVPAPLGGVTKVRARRPDRRLRQKTTLQ